MRRSSDVLIAVLAAAPSFAAPPGAPALARLGFVERRVELSSARGWHEAREGGSLRLGESIRTTGDAMVRLDLPWMTITLSPGSAVQFPDEYLLAAKLEQGRVALRAEKRQMLKLVTAEAVVRGQGRAVVRRAGPVTTVSALDGEFVVEGAGKAVTLTAGTGAVVRAGKPPAAAAALGAAPTDLSPGSDPRYVSRAEVVPLSWSGGGAENQIEVLPVGSEDVLIQRDVGAPPARVVIPWRGAFRWRVSVRDAGGLEGKPSADGFICVEE